MKTVRERFVSTFVAGVFVVVPVYLAILLLLKGMQSVAKLVRPVAAMVPDWLPAEGLFSLLLVVLICFVVGAAVRTRRGRAIRNRMDVVFFERLPGDGDEAAWKPALAEIDEALAPAFVIEEHDDGRFTVFVPSIPTPFAGAVYVLDPDRVHVLDVPFTQAIQSVSRWGSGAKNLVAAMQRSQK
jgi:uncharacterized membrane protein